MAPTSPSSARARRITLAALAVGAAAAWSAATAFGHRDLAASCTGSQLHGGFAVVRGSAGAGNIVYKLTLKNVSTTPCTLTGLPAGRLLGKAGNPLPTHIRPANPGALAAILVTLVPGDTTYATARFSPDVPGPGEPVSASRCEPIAYWLRVTGQGGGTTRAKISPPTPVCEHGALSFSAYSHKG